MQKKTNLIKMITSLLVLSTLASACAKQAVHAPNLKDETTHHGETSPESQPEVVELTPTYSDEKLGTAMARYEQRAKKIKTAQAVLELEKVKMSNVAMKYDPKERKFSVKGHASVLDENKKEIAASEFNLSAVHDVTDGTFRLIDVSGIKKNSDSTPIVRASVTCLSAREDDSVDCSSAVVDFYIAYKKILYTEQMETAAPKTAVKPNAPVAAPPMATTPNLPAIPETKPDNSANMPAAPEAIDGGDGTELQSESEEPSVQGRFEGQAQRTDLKQHFDADDEIQTVIKESMKLKTSNAPATTPSANTANGNKETVKPAPTSPAPIKQEIKPEVNTTSSDAKAATVDKSTEETPTVITQIDNNIAQTSKGIVRPINQALGYPNKGNLRNATSVLGKQKSGKTFFEIAFPERQRYFSTYETAEMLSRLGEKLNSSFNRKLEISDISKQRGGKLSPHLSHQIGMDADIGYPATSESVKFPVVVKMSNRQYNPSSFSVAKTYELLKYAFSQNDLKIDRIFADRKIKQVLCEYARSKGETSGKDKDLVQSLFKNIEHVNGHGDHFHIRMRCTPAHPTCRKMVYVQVSGC